MPTETPASPSPVQEVVETAWNLPPSWYTSPDVYEVEKEAIFRDAWHLVGRTEQIPNGGDRFAVELLDEHILVVRGRDDVVRAFANVCRHRGHMVDVECKSAATIRCPYHGWAYDLDGRCRKAKGMDGAENFDPKEFRLHAFECRVLGPWVFVSLGDPPPFEEVFGPIIEYASDRHLAADLEYRGGREWLDAPINWKSFVDNFDESYHLPYIHAYTLEQVVDWQDEWKNDWGIGYYGKEPYPRGPGARMAGAIGGVSDFRRLKPAIEMLSDKDKEGYTLFWCWPFTIFFFMPDGVITINLVPRGPQTLSDTWQWWMPPADSPKEKVLQGLLMHFGHIINEEDTEAMAHVQRGLNSRYSEAGRYAPELEDTLYHAHSLVRRYLQPLLGEELPPVAAQMGGNGNGNGHHANGNGAKAATNGAAGGEAAAS
jgi:phenylpropionate dioxygenase-like ring-hydroxylating dioxygenase large terminal subunit